MQQGRYSKNIDQHVLKARIFTFFDLEKNFLALDPTRDLKILFLDEPSTRIKTKYSRVWTGRKSSDCTLLRK